MLEYGQFDHGRYKSGLGDWNEKIKSGAIQPPEPPPPLDEIDPALREMCAKWGYLTTPRSRSTAARRAGRPSSRLTPRSRRSRRTSQNEAASTARA